MHSSTKPWFLNSPRQSSRRQQGFATAAKAMIVALGVSGVGWVATTGYQPRSQAIATSAVATTTSTDSTRDDTDPDAELREWLREPQPPTF